MDFVDLDKVLDEFEEEEKQALSIVPGQELKPSGYLEFLEKHQEQEWSLLNPSKFPSNSGYTLERLSAREPVNVSYDDPYDGYSASKLSFGAGGQVESFSHNGYGRLSDGKKKRSKNAIVTSLTRISVNGDDVNTVYTSDVNTVYTSAVKAPERKGIANCSERKGTIAYQQTEVQTDALSPLSEQELLLSPFPKSDIIVDGHGDTTVSRDDEPYSVGDVNYSPVYAGIETVDVSVSSHLLTHKTAASHSDLINDGQTLHSVPRARTLEEVDSHNSAVHFNLHSSIVNPTDSGIGLSLSEQTVGFHDPSNEHLEESDINRYLNELYEQKVGETSIYEVAPNVSSLLAPLQSAKADFLNIQNNVNQFEIEKTESYINENSVGGPRIVQHSLVHSDSLSTRNKSHAMPSGSDGAPNLQDPDIVLDLELHSRSENLGKTEPLAEDTAEIASYEEPQETNSISYVQPSLSHVQPSVSHVQPSVSNICDVDPVDRQILYNSLINCKMEIEMILDDIENSQSVSSSIPEHSSQGKMEIENILDEIISEQQNRADSDHHSGQLLEDSNLNSSHLQSHETHNINIYEGRPHEASQSAYDSDSLSSGKSSCAVSSETNASMLGARPKDPSALKKNRPNSLLGLSKVSFDTSAVMKPEVGVEDTPTDQQTVDTSGQFSDAAIKPQQSSNSLSDTLILEARTENETRLRLNTSDTEESDTAPVLHDFSQPLSHIETYPANDQSEVRVDGLDTAHSEGVQKMKRPTSLNLPIRPEFSSNSGEEGMEREDSSASPSLAGQSEAAEGPEHESTDIKFDAEGIEISSAPPGTIAQINLGQEAPYWIPDNDALMCMICQVKFTMWKRRHHCRACGKVLCAACCSQKAFLPYMENREARICVECHTYLSLASSSGTNPRCPNPNNPNEYCSKVPPTQQVSSHANPPVVMVPTGVLRTTGGQKRFGEPKQVMFSDGIRPGGELTDLDGPEQARPSRKSARMSRRTAQQQQPAPPAFKLREDSLARSYSLIPEDGLPSLIASPSDTADEAPLLLYAVNKNLSVGVKIVNLDCCVERVCWCFVTQGMDTAGQSEIIVLLELTEEELVSVSPSPPRDMFLHFQTIYEDALKGSTIEEMGHFVFHQNNLGNKDHGGFLFLPATFQCLNKLPQLEHPYLFAVLLQKSEVPWARVFPIRLMLRLGAEYRYYPCPLVSVRNRKSVFYEVGHTIINLLADFRSYQYMLSQIRGVTIHMENKKTVISFPRNRYSQVMKVVRNSNEHVMALGSSFSSVADSHLVCIQSEDGNYQTQAINIQNKQRQVTGASFVVFNGALKSSSGLRAKSSIVEDGLMVQVLPETLASVKEAMKNMTNHTIQCGAVDATEAEEVVELRWVDNDKNFNIGVKSYVDGASLEGVESISVKSSSDFLGENLGIRWTRVYFLQHQESSSSHFDPMDLSRLMEEIAQACCTALVKHLDELRKEGQVRLGLRVNLNRDNVGYEIGSKGQSLPAAMVNNLDTFLVPIVHQASEEGVVMELVFCIVE